MSFAEQLARASSKKNRNGTASIDTNTPSFEISHDSSAALSSFDDRIKMELATPPAPPIATPTSRKSATTSQSFSFADELHKKSQQSGRRKAISYINGKIEQKHDQKDESYDYGNDDDDEYSEVGFSLMERPTMERSETKTAAFSNKTKSETKSKEKGNQKRKLRPIMILPSESSMGEEEEEEDDGHNSRQLPQSPPLQQHKQQGQRSKRLTNQQITKFNSSENINNGDVFGAWAQIESLKRRVHEAEERAEMASSELKLAKERSTTTPTTMSNNDGDERKNCNTHDENDVTRCDNSISSSLSLQSSEIEEWKKRALEAEERLLLQGRQDPTMKGQQFQQKHLLSSPQQHLLPPSQSPQSTTQSSVSTTPRGGGGGLDEESSIELIRLKNAEIDVLRSQIHRLERRIQEHECDRSNEDLMILQRQRRQQQSHLLHHHHFDYDDSASSIYTGPPSVVGDDLVGGHGHDELRLLRNDVRNLQYQLKMNNKKTATITNSNVIRSSNCGDGNLTSGSTIGSTLSSLDENENNYDGAEEREVEVDEDDNNVDTCSSWGLCCFRRKGRKGYGRV